LRDLLSTDLSGIVLDYQEVHALLTPWRFLPAFDHPREPGACLVSRLTETGWEYRGSGESLTAHGEALPVPEPRSTIRAPELAAAYVIGYDGAPRRVGFAAGICAPQFSALGPELIPELGLGTGLKSSARLLREGREIWRGSAERDVNEHFADALAAIEPDHFRRAGHRSRGNAHIYFVGTKFLGAVDAIEVDNGDRIDVEIDGLGRSLRASIQVNPGAVPPLTAAPL
jgi:hypothetical protein